MTKTQGKINALKYMSTNAFGQAEMTKNYDPKECAGFYNVGLELRNKADKLQNSANRAKDKREGIIPKCSIRQ